VLPHRYFLEADVVLEHLAEVDRHGLADSFVDGVLDIELLKRIVTRVEHTEDTYYTIVVDFVIAEVEREQLVMSEKQLGDHHCAVCLDLVLIQIQILQVCAFFKSLSKTLSSITLNFIALKIETE
jgi:hypothetical protein